jgi:hypothetical protein
MTERARPDRGALDRMPAARRDRPGRSTGPRSPQGKARSAANARRHGLHAALLPHASSSAEVAELTKRLAGEEPEPHRRYFAAMAAEAIVELRRIARVRNALIDRHFAAVEAQDRAAVAVAARHAIADLVKLDRYEKRTFARKLKALGFL